MATEASRRSNNPVTELDRRMSSTLVRATVIRDWLLLPELAMAAPLSLMMFENLARIFVEYEEVDGNVDVKVKIENKVENEVEVEVEVGSCQVAGRHTRCKLKVRNATKSAMFPSEQ